MQLYFIEATVIVKMPNISGPFTQRVVKLVNAEHPQHAKQKFEAYVKQEMENMTGGQFKFDYKTVAGTI